MADTDDEKYKVNFSDLDDDQHPDAPSRLIIPTEDLLKSFHEKTNNRVINVDLQEIVTQIVTVFLNNKIDDVDALNGLPQVDRMRDSRFHTDQAFSEQVRVATVELGFALHERLKQYGVYFQGVFSYFFDGFVGYDIVLNVFPF